MSGARNGNGLSYRRRRTARNLRRRSGNGSGAPRWVKVLAVLVGVGFVGLAILVAAAMAVYRGYADDLVAPDELLINQPSYGTKIFDRNGKLLYEYLDDRAGLRRPIELANISEH